MNDLPNISPNLAEPQGTNSEISDAVCSRLLITAILLGTFGSFLFKGAVPGLNLALWIVTLIGITLYFETKYPANVASDQKWLIAPLFLLALCFIWRSSPVLVTLDLILLTLLLLLTAWRVRVKKLFGSELTAYLIHLLIAFKKTAAGLVHLVFRDIQWSHSRETAWGKHLPETFTGLIISLPLVLVFGTLFYSADLRFEKLIEHLFDFDLYDLFLYLIIGIACAWISGGYLRAIIIDQTHTSMDLREPRTRLGSVEINVVLTTLNLLFSIFVVIQLPYLFGGQVRIEEIAGLTYAEYARRGFFELVTVASLLVPLLLLADWLLGNSASKRLFRILTTILIGLMFIIMASAFQRMWLYQSAYGLTELRFYATAFMFWLAFVFVWFLCTVLRGKRNFFTFGALTIAYLMLVGMHLVNPDHWIARTNLERAREGKTFDACYTSSLSPDAIPVILENLDHLTAPDRQVLIQGIERFLESNATADFRSWNYARFKAENKWTEYEQATPR